MRCVLNPSQHDDDITALTVSRSGKYMVSGQRGLSVQVGDEVKTSIRE